jgi:putative acetyltransferase
MSVEIRLEAPEDRDVALEVERRAFDATGSAELETRIVRDVRDDDGSFALVATDGEEIVGHVQFSRGWIGGTPVVALGPIGVSPDRQREGIGSALVRSGLDAARWRGEKVVMLLGDPNYYGRFGFRPALPLGLRNPYVGVMPDGFEIHEEDLQLVFLDGDVPLAGEVQWHAAFG